MNDVNELIFDEQIEKCFLLLKEYFEDKKEDLAIVEYPDCLEYGSGEWLIYVFYSCLLDYGMRSKVYHQNLVYAYGVVPEIFHPKYVVDNYSEDSSDLLKILKEYVHPRYPNIAVNKWINLSKELAQFDDLKKKILSLNSFCELNKFIREIKGYGQKTGGLLLRLISEAGICTFTDEIGVIPLDRHDIEICYLSGIINKNKLSGKEIRVLSNKLIEVGRKMGLSPSLVDKYLWEIGNAFCNKKNCFTCPIKGICKGKKV